jgi:hypothetical protein
MATTDRAFFTPLAVFGVLYFNKCEQEVRRQKLERICTDTHLSF